MSWLTPLGKVTASSVPVIVDVWLFHGEVDEKFAAVNEGVAPLNPNSTLFNVVPAEWELGKFVSSKLIEVNQYLICCELITSALEPLILTQLAFIVPNPSPDPLMLIDIGDIFCADKEFAFGMSCPSVSA